MEACYHRKREKGTGDGERKALKPDAASILFVIKIQNDQGLTFSK